MSDEGEEQKQASSDADTPMSKKAKSEPAAAAADASVTPADSAEAAAGVVSSSSAAAASSSAPTPCARLDLDSLSVVFSLLNMRDFLHAVRVSRHWRSARVKKSAWPAFSLETMIQSLRDDDFDNPQRRKLEVALARGNKRGLSLRLGKPGMMDVWRHVTEIKLVHARLFYPAVAEAKQVVACVAMLKLLPQFASLAALTLDGFVLASDAAEPAIELFDALAHRVQMIGLFRCSHGFESQLHRLSSLRVLVLGCLPEAASLIPLHQLVYLHIERDVNSRLELHAQLGFVIRWLSVHHLLRSFSLEGIHDPPWRLVCPYNDFLYALLATQAQSPANVHALMELNRQLNAALDPAVPCALSDLSLNKLAAASKSLLGSVPSLTRLQGHALNDHSPARVCFFTFHLDASFRLALSRLQQLRITSESGQSRWHQLVHCTALRVVHLSQPGHASSSLRRDMLQSLLRAWSATLEQCSLDLVLDLESGLQRESGMWTELAACQRLRMFEVKLAPKQSLPAGLVAALQDLPAFQSLVLSFHGPAVCSLPLNLLSVMCRSRSFSTLHLHALEVSSQLPDFLQFAEPTEGHGLFAMLGTIENTESALLTARTIHRLRVVGHYQSKNGDVTPSFQLVGRSGQHVWIREF